MDKFMKLLKDKEKMKHYISYIFFGVLTTLVDWGVLFLFRTFLPVIDKNIANAIAILTSIIFAYFTNRRYVFKSVEKSKFREFMKFLLSRGYTFLFQVVAFWIFATWLGLNEYAVKLVISIVVIILNYVISRFYVFRAKYWQITCLGHIMYKMLGLNIRNWNEV